MKSTLHSRRNFLAATAAIGGGALLPGRARSETDPKQALIAISLDLEMTKNFPKWEDTQWDYEKGNLNEETRRYAVEAARRVKAHGGRVHFFLVGRALEQENVDWLKEIIADGHSVGNHTYDHVNVKAATAQEAQFRFRRSPWLVEGQSAADVVRENIRLASAAMQSRLGVAPAGFRTPGGFANGLADRPDLQKMLLELGFKWISAKYPAHPNSKPGEEPTAEVFKGIVKAQDAAQPFVYPGGLIEVPMSPISDIGAFRNGRWKLEHFLKAIRMGIEWAIARGSVFDLLSHPGCLYSMDPEFRAIELICELVDRAGDRAALVTLDQLAGRAKPEAR
jgi:peptidoglycan/xylan/chitin deacetylase (PgdA/CDA1 family)